MIPLFQKTPPPKQGQRSGMEWVKVSMQEFGMMTKDLPFFKSLQAVIGTAGAQAVQNLVYRKYAMGKPMIEVPPDYLPTLPDEFSKFFKGELDKIQRRKAYVDTLLVRARSGELRAQLAENIWPAADYYSGSMPPIDAGQGRLPPIDVGQGSAAWAADLATTLGDGALAERFRARIFDKEKAYRWITKGWEGEGLAKVEGELTKALATPSGGPPLGPDASMLQSIFKPVVIDLTAGTDHPVSPYRAPHPETPYPSSVGGTYLLNWIFQKTSNITWPPQGDAAWEDYAVFFLGAIGAVQAFPDGNKRMSRLAYAIVLLKGGREFKAPTDKFSAELYRMNKP
jgi:hypothetical protein